MEKKLKIENFASLITTTAAGKVVGIQISAEKKERRQMPKFGFSFIKGQI